MNQQIHEVHLSLQHLSAVVLPEMKRVSSIILVSASEAGTTHAPTLETLLLDAHRIAGAAVRSLAHVAIETDDSGVVKMRKPPLPLDIELEVLRFCSRVDLDKMQLVSKAKRVLVDSMADRLALHNVYRVNARALRPTDEKRYLVFYSTEQYYKQVATDVLEEIHQRDNEQNGRNPSNRNPFWRMRNAFVGTADFCPPEEFMAEFKELLRAFISHHKGAMQVGTIKLSYRMTAQWTTYLLGIAADDFCAKCLVVGDYAEDGKVVDLVFAAPNIRKARRITIDAHARDESLFGAARIASLVELATDCGDIRRIDILLSGDHFAECLTQWIQAFVGQKRVRKLVNNVLFHSDYDAVLPSVVGEPIARLQSENGRELRFEGEPCETEDVEEKSVFAFRNERTATEITAVVARYSYHDTSLSSSRTGLTFNFMMNPSGNLDVGDFSRMHLQSAGSKWYEHVTDFD